MAMAKSVYDLDVFKRAYRTSLEVHRKSLEFPKIEQFGGMGDQMRRASKSICANLAEGLGRVTTPLEQKRFLSIALGSCEEMRVWVRYCLDLQLIDEDLWGKWQKEYLEISKMLQGLAKIR